MARRIEKRESEAVRNAELQLTLTQLWATPPDVNAMQVFPSPTPAPERIGVPGQDGAIQACRVTAFPAQATFVLAPLLF